MAMPSDMRNTTPRPAPRCAGAASRARAATRPAGVA